MKGIFKKLIVLSACCAAQQVVCAQSKDATTDTIQKKEPKFAYVKPKAPKAISQEFAGGLRLNSNGWSVFMDLGKLKAKNPRQSDMFSNVRFYQLEFTEKKDPREQKVEGVSASGAGSNTYIYGKINNFYALKLGYGFRKLLVGKPDPGSVSIHWVNAFGVSVGALKPYYINVYSDPSAIKYKDNNKEAFLDQSLIEGNAGFSKGIDEVVIVPGGHFKTGMHFDFSANKKTALGVETGLNVEYYAQDLPLLANQKPSAYFIDLYVGIQIGKRW